MPEPTNKNFLSPVGFRFSIERLPNVNWFAQSTNLPGVTLGRIDMPTPFVDVNIPGDKIDFEDLNIRFKVDEDLKNWEEIQKWIFGLGFPESFDQYDNLIDSGRPGQDSRYSDATMHILNSNMNLNYEVHFRDLYPTSVSSLQFDSTVSDIDYVTADATFRYLLYEYKKV
jgi:hypothetical protein